MSYQVGRCALSIRDIYIFTYIYKVMGSDRNVRECGSISFYVNGI